MRLHCTIEKLSHYLLWGGGFCGMMTLSMENLIPKKEQIKFLQDKLKSQIEFANQIKQFNQDNPEIQERISKLEQNIQLLQNKLELEKLVDD